eukprot:SAG11_NODE_2956_length_2812_cov_2.043126_1_plen_352_part_00
MCHITSLRGCVTKRLAASEDPDRGALDLERLSTLLADPAAATAAGAAPRYELGCFLGENQVRPALPATTDAWTWALCSQNSACPASCAPSAVELADYWARSRCARPLLCSAVLCAQVAPWRPRRGATSIAWGEQSHEPKISGAAPRPDPMLSKPSANPVRGPWAGSERPDLRAAGNLTQLRPGEVSPASHHTRAHVRAQHLVAAGRGDGGLMARNLDELQQLREQGALTEKDFEAARATLLVRSHVKLSLSSPSAFPVPPGRTSCARAVVQARTVQPERRSAAPRSTLAAAKARHSAKQEAQLAIKRTEAEKASLQHRAFEQGDKTDAICCPILRVPLSHPSDEHGAKVQT